MKSQPKLVLRDKMYIPISVIPEKKIKRVYERRMYDEVNCARCPNKPDRHSYVCDQCESYRGHYKLWDKREVGSTEYYALPRADYHYLEQRLGISRGRFNILDKRSIGAKLDKRFKLTVNLYDYQEVAVTQLLEGKIKSADCYDYDPHGLLKAPARSGKTLMGVAIIHRLGRKALIMANQDDLLKQFIIEIEEKTNLKDISEFDGKRRYGICKTVEDFEKYDICLCTYQTFLSPGGKKKLNKIRHLFGTILVDEQHRANADKFSGVVSQFSAKYRLGVTATEKRKDRMHFIMEHVMGPVNAKGQGQTLNPKVYVHETKIAPKYAYKTWNGAMQFLAGSEKRIAYILEYIKRDLKNGHKIVIPVAYKKQAQDMVKRIQRMGYTAEVFCAGVDREKLLARARAGKIDVVVGIRSILATGVNVPCWSAIYTISPISNPPNYYQETARVRTPMEGKRSPIIRIFVDDLGMAKGCFRTCWFQTVLKEKFEYNEKTEQKVKEIIEGMRNRKSYEEQADEVVFDAGDADEKQFRTVRDKAKGGGKKPQRGVHQPKTPLFGRGLGSAEAATKRPSAKRDVNHQQSKSKSIFGSKRG